MTTNTLRAATLATLLSLSASAAALDYPPTDKGTVTDDYFGTVVPDPYRWLEDLDSGPTRAWAKAQREFSAPLLAALPERDAFRTRLDGLWNYERIGVPRKIAGRIFYTRNNGLQNQAALYLQEPGKEARVLLDPNKWSEDGTVALTQYEPSPDGKWIVYGRAASGSDWNEFRVLNIETGEEQPETLGRIKFSDAKWTADSKGFFYSHYPEPAQREGRGVTRQTFSGLEFQKLFYHRVGSEQYQDRLIFELPEQPKWFVGGELTQDGRYLFVFIREGSSDNCRLYYLDLQDPQAPKLDAPAVKLIDDFDASYQLVGSRGSVIHLLTSRDAPKGRIVAVDLKKPEADNWRNVVPEGADALSDAIHAGDKLVVLSLHDAASRLTAYPLNGPLDGKQAQPLRLPGLGSITNTLEGNELSGSPGDNELYFGYTSFNQPLAPYRVDLKKNTVEAFRAPFLSFQPTDYLTEQVFYTSRDLTRVPMFISYKKGIKRDGKARLFLHGYGGFNISKTPSFDASALAWMDKGGIYAVANLRGGGEYGEAWHEAGTKEHKQTVFDDFVAAAGYLVKQRYTDYPHIAIWGRSNGGLLVGASVDQYPKLWGAAVATVGVLDMLRFHKFTVGYAWVDDYGSSDDEAGFKYLYPYSPLHNVKPNTAYPPTLITTGDHDDRVHPAHSYKYAAALQAAQSGDAPILIRIDENAGHGGGKPLAKLLDEEADKLAFMWQYTAGKPEAAKPAADKAPEAKPEKKPKKKAEKKPDEAS